MIYFKDIPVVDRATEIAQQPLSVYILEVGCFPETSKEIEESADVRGRLFYGLSLE